MKNAFTKLASPIKLGPVEIKNRFIVSPMVMNCCNEDGTATERFIAYHEEKAKGGWGLIQSLKIVLRPFRAYISVYSGTLVRRTDPVSQRADRQSPQCRSEDIRSDIPWRKTD